MDYLKSTFCSISIAIHCISAFAYNAPKISNMTKIEINAIDTFALNIDVKNYFLQFEFGASIFTPTNENEIENINIQDIDEVWLVYSAYNKGTEANQKLLNEKRLANLLKRYPELKQQTNIRWVLVRQTGTFEEDSVKKLFHGFILTNNEKADNAFTRSMNINRSWDSVIVVLDVTTSMRPWMSELSKWLTIKTNQSRIDRMIFFNDKLGGMYFDENNQSEIGITTLDRASKEQYESMMIIQMLDGMSTNLDIPENNVAALRMAEIFANQKSEIVMVCDNNSTPRDIQNAYLLRHPINIVLCGATFTEVNPAFLEIAYITKGTVHTAHGMVADFRNDNRKKTLSINGKNYWRENSVFLCKNCTYFR